MSRAYLTIDDSPSLHMDALVDFLVERDIPALFFVRGDLLEVNPDPVVRAIERGFLIGNHTYAHPRMSALSFEEARADILKCEALIERCYRRAGIVQSHKTFRFSYLDRGCGPWVVDFDALSVAQRGALEALFFEGLNFSDRSKPAPALFEQKQSLQAFLAVEGYSTPFKGVGFDWWVNTEIACARDCFFTYSTSDWMLTKRHLTRGWPYHSIEDLRQKMDDDVGLLAQDTAHVILAHDQDELFAPVCGLIAHLQDKGFSFLEFK